VEGTQVEASWHAAPHVLVGLVGTVKLLPSGALGGWFLTGKGCLWHGAAQLLLSGTSSQSSLAWVICGASSAQHDAGFPGAGKIVAGMRKVGLMGLFGPARVQCAVSCRNVTEVGMWHALCMAFKLR
jgi:hypothetical protein